MTKIFASDFDGTLHFWDCEEDFIVSPADTQAILDFQEQGGLFGVCTGRPLHGLTKQIDEAPGLGFSFDFYITLSGAAIFDKDRQLIWNKTIPREAVEELYRVCTPLSTSPELAFVCSANDWWAFKRDPMWPQVRVVSSFDEIEGPFYGYGMENDTLEIAQQAADMVNERFAGVAHAYLNKASIDVVPDGCSKGTGLAHVAELLGATLTGGIGDSFNDLPLLQAADVSYTFKDDASASLHEHATLLVDSAAEALADFSGR